MSPKSTAIKATQRKVKAIPANGGPTMLYGRIADAVRFGFRYKGILLAIQLGKVYKGFYWRYAD